ncbi:hypothetical protein BKA62DRAFT_507299 [Auriculariales sp. MPI-PUGE-AT-0066]|nr:hypothetical protein BKA62DRAFT_507299 [Auriculariales sp. MPI-PUGE-AT-0066]
MASPHPKIVQELFTAAHALHAAAQGMTICKLESQRVATIAQDISACIENTSLRVHHGNQTLAISLSAFSALNITQNVFKQCAKFMADASARGALRQAWNTAKGEPSTTLGNYLAACTALKEVLVAKDNFCGLLESPERCSVGLSEKQSKTDLQLEVLRLSPKYDGFKAVVLGIANMTDGLPWPAKAVPQTVLQIITHIEAARAAPGRITELLSEVGLQWELVAKFHSSDAGDSEKLMGYVTKFFDNIYCIYIRLRVLAAIHPIKRYLGQQSMDAALAEESQRLVCATRDLESARDWSTHRNVVKINDTLTTVTAVVQRIRDGTDFPSNAAAVSSPVMCVSHHTIQIAPLVVATASFPFSASAPFC